MLYTLGKKEIYEERMASDEGLSKGISGSVWESFEKAKKYRDLKANKFGLYGVLADWSEDAKDIGKDFRYLTKAGKLVFIDDKTGKLI